MTPLCRIERRIRIIQVMALFQIAISVCSLCLEAAICGRLG